MIMPFSNKFSVLFKIMKKMTTCQQRLFCIQHVTMDIFGVNKLKIQYII